VRSAYKSVGPNPETKRSTAAGADIFAGQRTVMKSVRWGEYAPNHYAASPDAEIKSEAIDVAVVMLGRCAAVGPETASNFLM
jgi:hypothetical protein